MSKGRFAIFWSLILMLNGCTLTGSETITLEKELQEAIQNYFTVINEASITLNTSNLSSVATGEMLKGVIAPLEIAQENDTDSANRSSQESEVEWIEILASGSSWAVIEVKENYSTFTQNLQTGKKTYDGRVRWRIRRFLLIKEEGIWKVDRVLEFVDWSG